MDRQEYMYLWPKQCVMYHTHICRHTHTHTHTHTQKRSYSQVERLAALKVKHRDGCAYFHCIYYHWNSKTETGRRTRYNQRKRRRQREKPSSKSPWKKKKRPPRRLPRYFFFLHTRIVSFFIYIGRRAGCQGMFFFYTYKDFFFLYI